MMIELIATYAIVGAIIILLLLQSDHPATERRKFVLLIMLGESRPLAQIGYVVSLFCAAVVIWPLLLIDWLSDGE